ncbi:hypothetical protein, partial [Salmonella sp. s51228]|uniref:hypothetical protein n=1 Tax=Salmonella sp. s51228 TaxID=3159652 RepID=UPI00397F4ECB
VTPDYRNKATPVVTGGKNNETSAPGDFKWPLGLAIEHQTGRIYIADSDNNRVQVFTPNGGYSFMFSNNMNWPWGICINNNTVYVSQWNGHCITLYYLDGTYISTVGSYGSNNGQFRYPSSF